MCYKFNLKDIIFQVKRLFDILTTHMLQIKLYYVLQQFIKQILSKMPKFIIDNNKYKT